MPRLIVTLSPEQDRRVRRIARDRSISMAEVVRTALEALPATPTLDRSERVRRILELAATFRSDAADVSENHDQYLDEIYGTW